MRRLASLLSCVLFTLSVFGADEKPSLPSWFPPANGLYEVNQFTYHGFDQLDLHGVDAKYRTPPIDSKGFVTGKVWKFDMKNPKPEAWSTIAEALQRQGFHFIRGDMKTLKGSATFQKGEGAQAIYVAFWQCCNSVAIAEPASNPFHVTLEAPGQVPQTYGDKDVIAYLPPIDGGQYQAGNRSTQSMNYVPGCEGKSEVFAPEYDLRRYEGPSNLSDYAVRETYKVALRAAGWDNLCEGGSHALTAQFTKNGRSRLANITPHVSTTSTTYEIRFADAGAGFRAELKKNCKASLYGVNFDFNKATLRPDADPALTQLLAVLKEEPKLSVEIGGHTDNIGKTDYNLKLSDDRAASVRQWLVAHGISVSRLTSHGYGDTQPLYRIQTTRIAHATGVLR
jgi:Outer membrane protein and related peptidoglycan-associated (lipo)proteins